MPKFSVSLDDYDLDGFARLAASFGQLQFAYVVTPNVDHLIRYFDEDGFRGVYADADYVLLDSRFLASLLRVTHHISVKVCTGSDLTTRLLGEVIEPEDVVLLIGGTELQAAFLRERHQLRKLHHFNPPMGFIRSAQAREECLNFIESNSPFRFCFLAVGSPQQEVIAQQLRRRRQSLGLVLCVGASIDFLTGKERRAPKWMRALSCEWLFRLMQNPRRLASRYLVRGPRIFYLLRNFQFNVRRN